MSKLYLGSIDLNKINKADIVTTDKNGNAFQNGAKYLNVTIWLNDEPDQYGNSIGIKSGDKDNSYYVGNAKEYIKQGSANVSSEPVPNMYTKGADDGDDLPF
jgi:hypothetical protein